MPKRIVRYPIYLPVKITSEDAIILEKAAQTLQVSRCQVLRDLIRSLNTSQKTEAPTAV